MCSIKKFLCFNNWDFGGCHFTMKLRSSSYFNRITNPPVAQTIKNPSAIWESWFQSLGWEDLLEKGMATHSNFLSQRIPWTEEPGGL